MNTPHTPRTGEHPGSVGPVPAPPPDRDPATDTSRSKRNGCAIAGFIVSLVAIIPLAGLAYSFGAHHDYWFAAELDTAVTVLFVLFIFAPGELILLISAFILSLIGTRRAKKQELQNGSLGISGLIISTIATILLVVVTNVAIEAS